MIIEVAKIIKEYSVRNKADEDIPVYSVTNDKGFCTGYFNKDVSSKDKTTYKIVPRGYFAYNPSRINVGSVDWQNCEDQVIVSPLYVVFSVTEDVDQQYFLHYLKSDIIQTYIKEFATGSVRDNLKLSELGKFPINLIPLSEQKRVATHLDLIDNLIRQRNLQLEKLDLLVKSRFIEMFGDPVLNSKGFNTKKGIDLFNISNGKAVANNRRFESGVPAYGGNGVSWYTDDILCQKDTIVIGRVGFQSGNVHLVRGPVWITDNAMYISQFYDDSLSLLFLCKMMEHIDFTKKQDAGDLKKVTQQPFMEMEYILPPKSFQNEYIAFVAQVDKSKLAVQKSLEQLEILKKALMQEYFG